MFSRIGHPSSTFTCFSQQQQQTPSSINHIPIFASQSEFLLSVSLIPQHHKTKSYHHKTQQKIGHHKKQKKINIIEKKIRHLSSLLKLKEKVFQISISFVVFVCLHLSHKHCTNAPNIHTHIFC